MYKRQPTTAGIALLFAVSLFVFGVATAEPTKSYSGELREAWLDGKIETAFALNRHLNPLMIDVRVEDDVAFLNGTVQSDIDRDLAGQIALSVDGISKVQNELNVDQEGVIDKAKQSAKEAATKFAQSVDDATTTATIKSKLIANSNTKAMKINVDTKDDVVTLSGVVSTREEQRLAELLAKNTNDVAEVKNHLVVSNQ